MIHAVVSEHVNASAHRVRALYAEPDNWARLFPATIRGARVVRRDGDTSMVEIDHLEGRTMNILRHVSPTRIDLAEFKRRYEAMFVNEFIPEGDGMRFRLTASVRLKWPYLLAGSFLKAVVIARMRRYVVEPLKAAAEGNATDGDGTRRWPHAMRGRATATRDGAAGPLTHSSGTLTQSASYPADMEPSHSRWRIVGVVLVATALGGWLIVARITAAGVRSESAQFAILLGIARAAM